MRMKLKEIKRCMENGTTVAMCPHQSRDAFPFSKEVKILSLGEPRRVYSGERWDFSGHTVKDGIRIQYASGNSEVVGGHSLICPWPEYEEMLASHQAELAKEKEFLASGIGVCEGYIDELGVGKVHLSPKGKILGVIITVDEVRHLMEYN